MKHIIYIHPEEGIASLIDRIEQSPDDAVYLAADANPNLFADALNMKLIRREAAAMGKHITIVSVNPSVRDMAAAAGFEAMDANPAELERENEPIFTPPHEEQVVSAVVQEDPDEIRVRVTKPEPRPEQPSRFAFMERRPRPQQPEAERRAPSGGMKFSWKFIGISLVVAGGLAAAGFWALSPRVTVTIIPKKETLRFDFQATADTKITAVDVAKSRIPGQLVKVEKDVTGDFQATGKSDTETYAEGEITIYNEFGSAAQALVQNTRFETKDGKIFRIKNAVTVPAATVQGGKVVAPGVVTAPVKADKPGAAYNIGPSDFTIPGFAGTPKFAGFYGKSSKQMAGGGAGGSVVATADDQAKAKASLAETLASQIKEYISANVPKEMVVLDAARTDGTVEFSVDPPDASGTFRARLHASYEVFAFAESDIAALGEDYLSKRLLDTQRAVPGSRVISYADETMNAGKTMMTFTVKVNELAVGDVNEEQLRADLAGKGEDEIRQVLRANEAVESAEFSFWPFWISLAPGDPGRIKVIVQGV